MSKQQAARISNAQAEKDVSAAPAAGGYAHGPAGLLSQPGLGGKRARRLAKVRTKAWSDAARAAAIATRRRNAGLPESGNAPNADARNLTNARREAAQLAKVPKQPKIASPKHGGGKGGKGPKAAKPKKVALTTEQKRAARLATRDQNRASALAKMNIAPDGQQALDALRQGNQADPSAVARGGFVEAGLVHQAADGSYQLTPTGRAAMSAADAGDTGRLGATIASARDRATAATDRQARIAARRAGKKPGAAAAAAPIGQATQGLANQARVAHKDSSSAGDYLIVEDRGKPTTWHLQVKRNGKIDHGLMGAAWAALHAGFRGNTYQGPNKTEALSKLRALYAAEGMDIPATKDAAFAVFKDAAGSYRWVMLSSNSFRDRDNEIVSTKALDSDVARADSDHDYGPLRWWHVGVPFGPGLDLGDCDFNAMIGKMLIESGTFRDPAFAQAIAAKADQLQGSIGFTHPFDEPDREGVFWHIRRFERSLVPRGKAANPFTQLYVQEIPMDETKVKELAALLNIPVEQVQSLVAQTQTKEQKIAADGVAFKADDMGAVTEDALPPDAEDVADGGADEATEPDGDENMLTPAELGAIADAVVAKLAPMLDLEKKMAAHANDIKTGVAGMMGQYATKKDAEQADLTQQIANLTARLKELEGDQPKSTKGYRASLDTATVTTKPSQEPTGDPLNTFVNDFILGGQTPRQ